MIYIVIFSLLLWPLQNFAITKAVAALVHFETQANGSTVRNKKGIDIYHYEIPLEYVQTDFASTLKNEIKDQLIFEINGLKYVRWVINPEDTKWHHEVVKYFKSKYNLDLTPKSHFIGYQTSSRSYIVTTKDGKVQFSIKSSTDHTGGIWKDKKQEATDVKDARIVSDYLEYLQSILKLKNVVILSEPAAIMLPDIDQGIIVRDLGELADINNTKLYIPGFAVLNEYYGKQLATKNKILDAEEFWKIHYLEAVGRAQGEFAARTGMELDSPHSQNFLVETDANFKPTGRIVIRDLADLKFYNPTVQRLHPKFEEFKKTYSSGDQFYYRFSGTFSPFHGTPVPTWIDFKTVMSQWPLVYENSYRKSFKAYSGLEDDRFRMEKFMFSGNHLQSNIIIFDSSKNYWENLKLNKSPQGIFNCSFIFKQ